MNIITPPTSDPTSQWAYAQLIALMNRIKELEQELATVKKSIETSGK